MLFKTFLVFFSHIQVPLILLFMASFVASSSNMTDKQALVAFNSAITHDPTNTINVHSRGANFCSWVGVTCSKRKQRVTTLDFTNMGLEGTISSYVGNLSFLVSLSLSNNSFHGHIPYELGRLPRLKTLELEKNQLEGSIPPSLSNCLKLEIISLGSNALSGGIPEELGTLKNLYTLNLTGNNLLGTIPVSIENMSALEIFEGGGNKFKDSFPSVMLNISSIEAFVLKNNSFFGYLPINICLRWPRLEVLELYANHFIGQIPSSLCNCTRLRALDLSDNELNGSVPTELGTLQKLEKLFLDRSNLTSIIPTSLGNISSLTWFSMEKNNIHGGIPNEFGKLTRLEILNLQYNHLTGAIPRSLFNVSSLRVIAITDNSISGVLPADMGLWLPNLEQIYFALNQIGGSIPAYLSNSSKLFHLEMGVNMFTGPIPSSLGNLSYLRYLNIQQNRLTGDVGAFITALTNCRSLKVLTINTNPLGGVLPYSIGNLSHSLQIFCAGACQIKGSIPQSIGALKNLYLLKLGDNNLNGTIPSTIGNLRNLQGLFLFGNWIGGSIPEEICNLKNMVILLLGDNNLMGPIPHCIGSLSQLQLLSFEHNSLISSIPASLWTIENLINIYLSNNSLSGNLSLEMKSSRVLEVIDISQNHITGKIPTTLGTFESLRILNLSRNLLHEIIPDSLGHLQSLTLLDLSYNNLSGPIPKSLESLNYLEILNLSYNDLSGEIPNEGTFSNFTIDSFLANKDLCGELLLKPCSRKNSNTKQILLRYVIPIVAVVLIFACLFYMLRAFKHKNERSTPRSLDSAKLPEHKMITYRELRQSTNDFSEANLLGTGSYSSVYKGRISDGVVVAVKVFNPQEESAFKSFDAECNILRTTRHRNLVKIITSCSNPEFRALIMGYMSNGSLEKWLYSENHNLNLLQRINIMIDVATALDYLHNGQSEPVVHCDLKPSNILLDEDMIAHVSDFGIAKILMKAKDAMHTRTLGTIGYLAPEYGFEGRVSPKNDMYSFGIIMLEIATGKKPTDKMFVGVESLREWVGTSFPNALVDVVDSILKPNKNTTTHVDEVKSSLFSLLEMGLECSRELPEERMDVKDVVAKLTKIKLKLLSCQILR